LYEFAQKRGSEDPPKTETLSGSEAIGYTCFGAVTGIAITSQQ